ncbi:MAG: hypothetical protein ACR2MO_12390 [Acidimicrobiales bacterium]
MHVTQQGCLRRWVAGTQARAMATGKAVFAEALVAVWARVQPARPHPWLASMAPGDNLQRPMNLIMPLRSQYALDRGNLTKGLVKATDMIFVGLNNVGTVHFARFDVIDGNLCMLSVYDGELSGYIRDFIAVLGQGFDMLMGFVKDPPPTPVAEHPDEFIAWVAARDAFQFPDESSDLRPELSSLERESLLMLRRHRNVQLGFYRCYPGYSAAQIRKSLEIGW